MAQPSVQIDAFVNRMAAHFPHLPTDGQGRLIQALARFQCSVQPRCALMIRGYAGTGKTTSVAAFVATLKDFGTRPILLAPTGRAAKVMQSYSNCQASTIHRLIYRTKKNPDGTPNYGLAPNTLENAIFVVDEASMIGDFAQSENSPLVNGRSLLDDLMEFVFTGENCKLVLVGDDAQLPPVGETESPALNEDKMRREFGLTVATIRLTDVVRQELESGILLNAHGIRLLIDQQQPQRPKFSITGKNDVHRIDGNDLQEYIEDAFRQYGEDQTVIITRSNKRAQAFNQQIRHRILWREEALEVGDRLMIVKNNYHWLASIEHIPTQLLANGDVISVTKIIKRFKRYGIDFANVEVEFTDAPHFHPFEVCINLSILSSDLPSIPFMQLQALRDTIAEDYIDLGSKSAILKAVKGDECYQALQVKFAWSMTCHKAQGGQWESVIVDPGYVTEDSMDLEWLRWLYTAFTRSKSSIALLNFSDDFFE
ncbi:MAG: AAA family ATPase [Bacteroidetes bacterium]|nr:AAA family ATPase [Bacteroidota bacterium]MDA1335780.1 AAA family ATPase [Bacteroidota bacterium]